MQEHSYILTIVGTKKTELGGAIMEEDYLEQILGEHLEDNHPNVEVGVRYIGSKTV
jgi:hypothetical protein